MVDFWVIWENLHGWILSNGRFLSDLREFTWLDSLKWWIFEWFERIYTMKFSQMVDFCIVWENLHGEILPNGGFLGNLRESTWLNSLKWLIFEWFERIWVARFSWMAGFECLFFVFAQIIGEVYFISNFTNILKYDKGLKLYQIFAKTLLWIYVNVV